MKIKMNGETLDHAKMNKTYKKHFNKTSTYL